MTPQAAAIAGSPVGSGASWVARVTATASSTTLLIRALQAAQGGTFRRPTAAELAGENAKWDAVDARYPDALDALLASLEDEIARGESQPLNTDELL